MGESNGQHDLAKWKMIIIGRGKGFISREAASIYVEVTVAMATDCLPLATTWNNYY